MNETEAVEDYYEILEVVGSGSVDTPPPLFSPYTTQI
jgi:hypothetical protein